jgi:hypothetical protein
MVLQSDNNMLVQVVVVAEAVAAVVDQYFYHKTHPSREVLLEYQTQLQPYPYQQLP